MVGGKGVAMDDREAPGGAYRAEGVYPDGDDSPGTATASALMFERCIYGRPCVQGRTCVCALQLDRVDGWGW